MPRIKRENTYGIVGDGRAARHFGRYLKLRGIPFKTWRRGARAPIEQRLAGCAAVLLLINDDAITPFIAAHRFLRGKRLVHFSGSLALAKAAGMHPLVSFGPRLLPLADYERIPFIVEKGGPSFRAIFPRLKNPSYGIEPAMKPYYHAICVMAGNFSVLLWQKLSAELSALSGAPSSAARPYLESVFSNLRRDPASALTGPFARRDLKTIRRNLAALRRAGDAYVPVYRAFSKVGFQEA